MKHTHTHKNIRNATHYARVRSHVRERAAATAKCNRSCFSTCLIYGLLATNSAKIHNNMFYKQLQRSLLLYCMQLKVNVNLTSKFE